MEQEAGRGVNRLQIVLALVASLALVVPLACQKKVEPPPPADGLVHHFDFSGEGTIVFDRVASRNGLMKGGGRLDGDGSVTLDGDDDFVDLPNGIISAHENLSLELVLRLNRLNGRYCRAFSFGSGTLGEVHAAGGLGGSGTSFFHLTFQIEAENAQELAFKPGPPQAFEVVNARTFKLGVIHHVMVVVDQAEDVMIMYVDGKEGCRIAMRGTELSSLKDVNNWLGRSQWTNDKIPDATFWDLKIYNRAIPASEVEQIYSRRDWRPVRE